MNTLYVIQILFILALRNLVGPELLYRFFYQWMPNLYLNKKIQTLTLPQEQLKTERQWSLYSAWVDPAFVLVVFLLHQFGLTQFYFSASDYGWAYTIFSFFVLIFLQDTHYYFLHRIMHSGWLYRKVHAIHHKSKNPNPWSATNMHPIEKMLELSFYPLVAILLPLHFEVFLLFWFTLTITNLTGHAGFEFDWLKVRPGKLNWWGSTSTFHNMHHLHVNCNYGLYLSLWDKLFKTEHPKYEETYRSLLKLEK